MCGIFVSDGQRGRMQSLQRDISTHWEEPVCGMWRGSSLAKVWVGNRCIHIDLFPLVGGWWIWWVHRVNASSAHIESESSAHIANESSAHRETASSAHKERSAAHMMLGTTKLRFHEMQKTILRAR